MKTTQEHIEDFYDFMEKVILHQNRFGQPFKQSTETIIEDDEGYELDEDGNRLSCCGDVLDPDIMLCPSCKEHC